MEKIITPAYQISGKRKKLVGYIGELRDGDFLISSMEYGSYSQAEAALDALAFEILTDLAEQGLVDELPAFEPTTCVFCHKPHHPADCPEMRAALFAPIAPDTAILKEIIANLAPQPIERDPWILTEEQAAKYLPNGIELPLDVDYAPIGPEV